MTHDDEITVGLTELRDLVKATLPKVQALAAERDELREKLKASEQEVTDAKMQRDVFCEKLNEYIDKTKEAEKRAETAGQERDMLVTECIRLGKGTWKHPTEAIEQARAEGYERRVAEEAALREHRWCSICSTFTIGKSCPDHPDAPSLKENPDADP